MKNANEPMMRWPEDSADADHSFGAVLRFAWWMTRVVAYAIAAAMIIVMLSGCQTLGNQKPPPPKGELCSHNKPAAKANCTSLDNGQAVPSVPIEKTDKWIMFSPATWESIQNYIDALIRALERVGTKTVDVDMGLIAGQKASGYSVPVSIDELKQIRDRIRWLKHQNDRQRRR